MIPKRTSQTPKRTNLKKKVEYQEKQAKPAKTPKLKFQRERGTFFKIIIFLWQIIFLQSDKNGS